MNLGEQGTMAVLRTNIAAEAWESIPAADKSFKCTFNCFPGRSIVNKLL
jgi:hypothetical protein